MLFKETFTEDTYKIKTLIRIISDQTKLNIEYLKFFIILVLSFLNFVFLSRT